MPEGVVPGWFLLALAVAGPYAEAEDVRFSGFEPAPVAAAPGPTEVWTGGARSRLDNIVAIETRLQALGARPDQAVLISAQLDWGDLVSGKKSDGMRFERSAVTVRAQRLSDGEVLRTGQVTDETGTYDLADPDERARLCTRARAGELGALQLVAWSGEAPTRELESDPGFVLVDADERSAVVDLRPGESATVVEVLTPGRSRKLRVRRSMTVDRGDKTLTLTEGDVLQRICLEY